MASLERRADRFGIVFRFGGQKFSRSLKTRIPKEATAVLARLEDNLRRLELGALTLPDGADPASFLLSDGRLNGKPKAPAARTLAQLLDAYAKSLTNGSLEQTTLDCVDIHIRHHKLVLGDGFSIRSLDSPVLRRYVDVRAEAKGLHGRKVSATTIKKELVTFAAVWDWASNQGMVNRPFPKLGLRYPKTTEKPAFQTWSEIERKIKRGGLTNSEQVDLWDCLFLTLPEIDELLAFVKKNSRHPFVYPMFAFAAHTGASGQRKPRQMQDLLHFGEIRCSASAAARFDRQNNQPVIKRRLGHDIPARVKSCLSK